jgi:hypothetical protein
MVPVEIIRELVECLEEAEPLIELDDPLRGRIELAVEDYKYAEAKG